MNTDNPNDRGRMRIPWTPQRKRAAAIGTGVVLALAGFAAVLDYWGPATDLSANRALRLDGESMSGLPHANHGAMEGGDPGTHATPESSLTSIDVPTGGKPSPLFGAGSFEQRLLLVEEFGTRRLNTTPAGTVPFPRPSLGPAPEQDPTDLGASGPSSAALDAFQADPGLYYAPTQLANTTNTNPWEPDVEAFLGRTLDAPPAEGRPPGQAWGHQRWNEFQPQVFVKAIQAGARQNHGARDVLQRHGYNKGEFAPGGLYHTVYDTDLDGGPVIQGTTNGINVQFHPNMPVQNHNAMWTWDGTVPPKLLVARYGEAILFRHYNGLPIDPSANYGFGLHTISTHEHNGHNPAESDGFTQAFFFPGQYYDYRWPMQLAGYDTVNTAANDPRAAFPCSPGETLFVNDYAAQQKWCDNSGRIQLRGDYRETMSTHWFHDHMLDYTAQNVYKGNAAVMNYYSALDRGNEGHSDGVNLKFPSGTALAWGNRDYDMNLVIGDKAWDQDGQLWFNIFNLDGFLGDRILTNAVYHPYVEVRARKYRLRILNGAVSRYFKIALVKEVNGAGGELAGPPGSGKSYDRVPFHMIANDGNILQHALPFDGTLDLDGDGDLDEHRGALPMQSIAERYDVIVDFAQAGVQPGDRLYFVNTVEHTTGRRPNKVVPLSEILSESYKAVDTGERYEGGDPTVGKFLQFRVVSYSGTDLSMDPNQYEPGGTAMTQLPIDANDTAKLATARHRSFKFGRSSGTDDAPWTIKTDGGPGLTADPRRVSAAPQLATGPTQAGFGNNTNTGYDSIGTMEIWSLDNGGGWSHPIHIHFEEGVILSRDGKAPPMWERLGRKDMYRLGSETDSSNSIEVALRFREFAGTFVEHCHNTQHEDHAMLLRWDLEHPGQVELLASPMPTWDGVTYVDTHALPTIRTGDGYGPRPAAAGEADAAAAGNEMEVAVSIPGGVVTGNVVLGASGTARIDDRAVVTGLVTSTGTTVIGNDALVGDVVSNGNITVGDRSRANVLKTGGVITTNQWGNAVIAQRLTGQVFPEPAEIELGFLQPLDSNGDVWVNWGQNMTLTPGRYNALGINSGATVTFTSGTYFFTRFDLNWGAFAKVDDSAGPVILVISDWFATRGQWTDIGAGSRQNLLIAYTGTQTMYFEQPFDGFVVAPNGFVRLTGNNVTHKGAYFGKEVEVTPGVALNAAPFDPNVFVPAPFQALEADAAPEAEDEEYVKDRVALVALGKALFWDAQLGVDNQACASCHYSAGADLRVKNQLSPGLNDRMTPPSFDALSGGAGGPNYTLAADDFPLRKLFDPADRLSDVVFDAGNDVVSSQGTIRGNIGYNPDGTEVCSTTSDELFNVDGNNTRRVAPRNAPTTINAVFNVRNFWDGRANNHFNGMNPFGLRDTGGSILEVDINGDLVPALVDVADASLASQAVGPPLSHLEMNCGTGDASFVLLGRRILDLQPLELQDVHPTDSVLGALRDPAGGIVGTYRDLIETAFADAFWNSAATTPEGYELIENNFSLFFGLAIQAYEATLVSDQTRFDEFANGNTAVLSASEARGLALFTGTAGCIACHPSPVFSGAVTPDVLIANEANVIERMNMAVGTAVYDRGFYNLGVTPTSEDVGVGGEDPWGNPLSFTLQEIDRAAGIAPVDTFVIDPALFLALPGTAVGSGERDAVDGAFKTPTLRNVELTGPYFHNGGQATLRQVVEFYNRGGDRRETAGGCDSTGWEENCSNLDVGIVPLGMNDQQIDDLVAFLKVLTDERVRQESAPFDHPSLPLSVGHVGDEAGSVATDPGVCDDELVVLPAIGATGRAPEGLPPLPSFEQILGCVDGDPAASVGCFRTLYGAL